MKMFRALVCFVMMFVWAGVSYAKDWQIAEKVISAATGSSQIYVYLSQNGDGWSVVNSHSPILGGDEPINIDERSDVERLIVDTESGSVALSIPTLKKSGCRGTGSWMNCNIERMPLNGVGSASCVVGVGHGRDATIAIRKYTFCNSYFVECQKDTKGILKMGVSGLMGSGSAMCNAKFNPERLQSVLSLPGVSESIEREISSVKQLIKDQFVKNSSRAAEEKKQREIQHAKEVEDKALEERRIAGLFEKGQQMIRQAAVGELLCADVFLRFGGDVIVSGFLEDVKGKKIQLRVNTISAKSRNESWQGDAVVDGVNFRSGGVVWVNASQWRACQ